MTTTAWMRRFWKKVEEQPNGCWEWVGCRHSAGYGRFNVGPRVSMTLGTIDYAHRLSYEIANGPIPDGMFVCHHCDNPPCVNPAHMFLGTQNDNNIDKARKGRTINPLTDRLKTRTHCPKGHPYDEKNTLHRTYKNHTGEHAAKACRECLRAWGRAWSKRKRQKAA